METIQKTDYTHNAVDRINSKRHLKFMSKSNRDIAFKLILKDINSPAVKKSSVSGQLIHPEYIEDYVGEIETGFGNSMYQTYFKKLYKIMVE